MEHWLVYLARIKMETGILVRLTHYGDIIGDTAVCGQSSHSSLWPANTDKAALFGCLMLCIMFQLIVLPLLLLQELTSRSETEEIRRKWVYDWLSLVIAYSLHIKVIKA